MHYNAMVKVERHPKLGRHVHRTYRLTSLQIGDMQSYISDLYLHLTCESNKLFILVDNNPWVQDRSSRPVQLWQLMVTKSRVSPFACTTLQPQNENSNKMAYEKREYQTTYKGSQAKKWFSVVDDAKRWHRKALSPVKDLRYVLRGCIVFEIGWSDVRGINYLNELQTDTSIALEVKTMIKKEFDNSKQALDYISSKCLGARFYRNKNIYEFLNTKRNVRKLEYDGDDTDADADDDDESVQCPDISSQNVESRGLSLGRCGIINNSALRQRKNSLISNPSSNRSEGKYVRTADSTCPYTEETESISPENTCQSHTCAVGRTHQSEFDVKYKEYKDVLVIFKFNDPLLPFELKEVVMSDLRLLRLLESGLPSWVLFFQSYPLFCKLYCPWMRPLARSLYVAMSIITVLIGFYDLYKNVPVLKTAAAHLFGPLFEWIETCGMVSRLKYLGTMLFLQNFEKACKWFLAVIRAGRQLAALVTKPMAEPFMELVEFILPTWEFCIDKIKDFIDLISVIIFSTFSIFIALLQVLIWPFVALFSLIESMVTMIIYLVVIIPVRVASIVADCVGELLYEIYNFVKGSWQSFSGTFQLMSASTSTNTNSNAWTGWRVLWNDLFSKVFQALRSIVNGFVAFFTACNRHRLSTYNHLVAFFQWLSKATCICGDGLHKDGYPVDDNHHVNSKERREIYTGYHYYSGETLVMKLPLILQVGTQEGSTLKSPSSQSKNIQVTGIASLS